MTVKKHSVSMSSIGMVKVREKNIPRHWSVSEVEGCLVLDRQYRNGLKDIQPGQHIVVIFHFHQSPAFSAAALTQTPPHGDREMGIFSTCSPVRPNPLGLSILEVLEVQENRIQVRGVDMLDGTPILDIKPHIK